jgi:2-amino-4-hydroxy-6-hydroxymethyldihydropteridine diphosphokinase
VSAADPSVSAADDPPEGPQPDPAGDRPEGPQPDPAGDRPEGPQLDPAGDRPEGPQLDPAGDRPATGAAGPVRPVRVVLALGSNLGDRLANLQGAVDTLLGPPGLDYLAVSPVYETAPVGGPSQPNFLNAVLLASTMLPARAILARGQAAEAALHRVRTVTWGPRTLDVDVIAYDDVVSDDPVLTLPHPRAHERAFVLVPWHDVDPAAVIPGRGRIADLLAAAAPAPAAPAPAAPAAASSGAPAPPAAVSAAVPQAGTAAGVAAVRRVPLVLRPPS